MAFTPSTLGVIVQPIGSDGMRFINYRTDDAQGTVTGTAYFEKAPSYGIRLHDLIFVSPLSTVFDPYILMVDAMDAGGNATASLSDYDDLAATAVQPDDLAPVAYSGSQDNMSDGTTNKNYSATEQAKLSGIGAGANAVKFDTLAAAEAFTVTSPDAIHVTGALSTGELGPEGVVLEKAASEPSHDGKVQLGTNTWYEVKSSVVPAAFFRKSADSGDFALALNRAFDYVTYRGGGEVHLPNHIKAPSTGLQDLAIKSAVSLPAPGIKVKLFGYGRKLALDSAFILGGAKDLTNWLSASGGSSITLTSTEAVNVASSDVDIGTNRIAIAASSQRHLRKTGLKVQVSGSDIPAGLSASTDYWTIWDEATGSVGFASSIANAEAGTLVDLSDAGSGTITITRQNMLSKLYGNYAVFDGSVAALGTKGTRINISNRSSSFAVRPTTLATVHYIDTEKNIIDFYPALTFDTTISNATTGEITATDIGIEIYPDDIDLTLDGVNVEAAFLPVGSIPSPTTQGQNAGAASAYGVLGTGGVFRLRNCSGLGINTFFRGQECVAIVDACNDNGGGDGIPFKVDSGSLLIASNLRVSAGRHGVDIGSGSNQVDGSAGIITNCLLSTSRQAKNETLRPGTEAGAFRMHPNAVWGYISNCELLGGYGISNGHSKLSNCRIYGQQTYGMGQLDASGNDSGSIEVDNCQVLVPRFIPLNDEGNGQGSFSTTATVHGDGSVKDDFATTDVNITTDVITVAHDLYATGQRVRFHTTGVLPAGLSPRTDYWTRRLSSTTITVHTSKAGATANTGMVDITDVGSGTHTITYAYPEKWRFAMRGGTISILDGMSWGATKDLPMTVGPMLFDSFLMDGVTVNLTGSSFRSLAVTCKGTGTGDFRLRGLTINGGGLAANVSTNGYADDWRRVLLDDIEFTNTRASYFAAVGLDVGGDTTSTGPTEVIRVRNVTGESIATTGLLRMAAVATRRLEYRGVVLEFTPSSGTCGYGLRAHSNQNKRAESFRYYITDCAAIGRPGVNTITTGIQILGGGAVGGVTAGFIEKGNDAVSCTTAITTTGARLNELTDTAGSATFDPASIANAATVTTTVTSTGAALGDLAVATFSLDLAGVALTAYVSATNTVTCVFTNNTGSAVDLASGTLRVKTSKIA